MLEGLDAEIVYDIEDVGSRYYTFIYTLAYMMEACGQAGIEVARVSTARTPIQRGGHRGPDAGARRLRILRGPLPDAHAPRHEPQGNSLFSSAGERGISCRLEVVEIEGWDRTTGSLNDAELPLESPSPNMPTVDTECVPRAMPAEGPMSPKERGTTRPSESSSALDPAGQSVPATPIVYDCRAS